MDEKELTDLMWQRLKDVCAYNPTGTGKEECIRLVLVTKNSVAEAVSKLMLDKSIVVSRTNISDGTTTQSGTILDRVVE